MRSLIFVLVLLTAAATAFAMGGPAPKPAASATSAPSLAAQVFMIDDFESGSLKSPREWWTFDLAKAEVTSNKDLKDGEDNVVKSIGNYSLHLAGPAKSWYAGGCGTYLAKEGQDLSIYDRFQMDVYGSGPGSGTIKVVLVDDDNNNWNVEADPKTFKPLKDDEWTYEQSVDWIGWKRVSIPISDFVVDNAGSGDGTWNPQQTNGSGGLLQMQLICIGSSDKGNVNFYVDNVALTVGNK